MYVLPQWTNRTKSRYDDPALAFYQYNPLDNSPHSVGIKKLKEAALARELAWVRLLRLLRLYAEREDKEDLSYTGI